MDSARWDGFSLRGGDIVISARSRCGTTWVQAICALLVFQTPDLPAPLAQLSPWLDWLSVEQSEVLAALAAQEHRRFIKTHTPLDGLPLDPKATYIVAARHPLDMAVSLYHHYANLDLPRIAELEGRPSPGPARSAPPLHDWLLSWITEKCDPTQRPDSLPGAMRHVTDAWSRRAEPNVVLVHYHDLLTDLGGQMRRLAARLGITVPESTWPELVNAATFGSMRSRADRFNPDPAGVFLDRTAFFRRGESGAGAAVLSPVEISGYHLRTEQMACAPLLSWLHRPS
jgi:aryl sulfotransferase